MQSQPILRRTFEFRPILTGEGFARCIAFGYDDFNTLHAKPIKCIRN